MKTPLRLLALLLGLLSAFTSCQKEEKFTLVIHNVNVVDVAEGKILPQQDVCLRGDRIVAIRPSNKTPEADTMIDGSGQFLIPGLWDMHTHNWWQIHFSDEYVQNGVLGVRNMYTPMKFIQPLKDSIQKGLIEGPHYYAAGRVIEGRGAEFPDWLVVDTVTKVNSALDTLQMEGSEFVKVYNKIPHNVYVSLMEECKRRNLRVEGHLPMEVSGTEASELGQRSFEHLLGMAELCTSDTIDNSTFANNWFSAIMKNDHYGLFTIDENVAANNLAVLKKNNTHVCPTLVVLYNYFHPDTLFEAADEFGIMPQDVQGYWTGEFDKLRKKDSLWKQNALQKYENMKKVTNLLYKHGVPLLAGTDVCNPFCYPGYSLHRELLLLRDCGIPDRDILKMATINCTKFIGIADQGEVKEGFLGSMVLLRGNPLEDIGQTRNISQVILKGKLIKRKNGK